MCVDRGDADRGLYKKFKVERTDGRSAPGEKHHGCEYFVLDMNHDHHARAALSAYVRSLEDAGQFMALAADLRDRYLQSERADQSVDLLPPLRIERYHPDIAPKGARVLVAGGIARKLTGDQWVSCMGGPNDERPLNWTPKWWTHLPEQNDT